MASSKKRRKSANLARKDRRPATGPFRHPDGDRRRRGGPSADQAIRDKRAMQQFPLPPVPEDNA
jgi:hypothetical protein